jgi:hypothetical protein
MVPQTPFRSKGLEFAPCSPTLVENRWCSEHFYVTPSTYFKGFISPFKEEDLQDINPTGTKDPEAYIKDLALEFTSCVTLSNHLTSLFLSFHQQTKKKNI